MPDHVEAAVETLLKGKASDAAKADSTDTAPAEHKPGRSDTVTTADGASTSSESTDSQESRTAFEQELIEEWKEEYDQLPETARKPFLDAIKRTYRKNARQMTELGVLRKGIASLKDAGITQDDIKALLEGKASSSRSSSTTEPTVRGFRRFLDKANNAGEREDIQQAEQVVRELFEDLIEDHLFKRVKPLQEKLETSERQQLAARAVTLEREIDNLEDTLGYPGSVVETYRERLTREGLRYPTLSAEELLFRIADLKDLKSAVLKASQSREGTPKRGTDLSMKPPASVAKKTPTEPSALPRNARGVVSISKALDLLLRRK